MICLGKLIVRELWRIYFNFEEHIHLSNRKPNHSMFFTFYILYVPVKLWHFILRTMNINVQSIQIPSCICISRTATKISMNRKFNSFVANWYDSHINFLADCWMCSFKMMILIQWNYVKINSNKQYRSFGFIQTKFEFDKKVRGWPEIVK